MNNLSVYSCTYPTGIYSGRGFSGRFLCVLPPEKIEKIRDCRWLCKYNLDTTNFNIYVYISPVFPYTVFVSETSLNTEYEVELSRGQPYRDI